MLQKTLIGIACLGLAFFLSCNTSSGLSGTLDTTFGTSGIVSISVGTGADRAYASILQSDGKILIAGSSSNGTNLDFAVVRLNTDGSLDTTFGTGGIMVSPIGSEDDVAYAIALQTDGKIILGGTSNNGSNEDYAFARFTTAGALDSLFGSSGTFTFAIGSGDDEVRSLEIQSDGKILGVGFSDDAASKSFTIARLSTAGSLDATFDTDGKVAVSINFTSDDQAYASYLSSDDKLIVAGSAGTNLGIAKLLTTGALDTNFGSAGVSTNSYGGTSVVRALGVDGFGRLYLMGYDSSGANSFALMRYLSTGLRDTSYTIITSQVCSDATSDQAFAGALDSNSAVFLAGQTDPGITSTCDDVANKDMNVMKVNTFGSQDSTFDSDGNSQVDVAGSEDEATSLLVQSDGNLVVTGSANTGSTFDFAAARLYP